MGTILASYDLQVTRVIPTKFQVNGPFGSGVKAENRFSSWPPWWASWISARNDFSYFYDLHVPVIPILPPSVESIGLQVQE